jgi:hypothetical protein
MSMFKEEAIRSFYLTSPSLSDDIIWCKEHSGESSNTVVPKAEHIALEELLLSRQTFYFKIKRLELDSVRRVVNLSRTFLHLTYGSMLTVSYGTTESICRYVFVAVRNIDLDHVFKNGLIREKTFQTTTCTSLSGVPCRYCSLPVGLRVSLDPGFFFHSDSCIDMSNSSLLMCSAILGKSSNTKDHALRPLLNSESYEYDSSISSSLSAIRVLNRDQACIPLYSLTLR